jgi:plasmid stability protein
MSPDNDSTDDGLPAKEAARARRRDRDMEAERRELLRPGMAKVFRQITEAAAKPPSLKQQKAKRAKA